MVYFHIHLTMYTKPEEKTQNLGLTEEVFWLYVLDVMKSKVSAEISG